MFTCQLTNVTKCYGEKKVLDKICLDIEQGEFVAITGKSGKGKTTLLNVMGMFERADSGSVQLFGEEFSPKNLRPLLHDKISYLFQNFALIDNKSIENNLAVALTYSKQSKQEKKIWKILLNNFPCLFLKYRNSSRL